MTAKRTPQEQQYWDRYQAILAAQAELELFRDRFDLSPEETARKSAAMETLGLQPWQLRAAGISPYP